MDRDVVSSDEGRGSDVATRLDIAIDRIASATPEELASALTELSNDLGLTVAFTTGTSGLTVTSADGSTSHYAFAGLASGQAVALGATAAATVTARFQSVAQESLPSRPTVRQALAFVIATAGLSYLLALLTGNAEAARQAEILGIAATTLYAAMEASEGF